MRKILLSITVLLTFCLQNILAQNLLLNPGFETWSSGRPSNWTVSNATQLTQNNSIAGEGTFACQVNSLNTSANFNIYQAVAVTAGKTYRLRLSYYVISGDGTDAKIISYFRNSSNVAIKMSLEDSLALKGPGGNAAFFPSKPGSWNTYTCDVVAPVGATTFLFYVRTTGYANMLWDDFYFGENNASSLTSNKTALSGFTYIPGAGPSAEQSFTIKGNNITGPITVTAPDNYEISGMSGSAFTGTNSLTIAPTGTQIGPLPVYVRLKSRLVAGSYNGSIAIATANASPLNVTLSGQVGAPAATLTASASTLAGFSYAENYGPSAQQSFTVSGSYLTGSITVAAPVNFEISALGGSSFTGTSSLSLAQSGGSVSTTTLYVRLKQGLKMASYSGNITLSSSGTSKNIALSGSVTQAPGIILSTDTLNGFSYYIGSGPSVEKSFSISGTGLTSFVVVTPPNGYEISSESGAAFSGTNQLIIPETNGIVSLTPVYIRLMQGLPVKFYPGTINISSSGNTTKTISVQGEVKLTTSNSLTEENVLKVIPAGNTILVEGTVPGDLVSLFSATGIRLQTVKSNGATLRLTAQPGSIYLLKVGHKVIKTAL